MRRTDGELPVGETTAVVIRVDGDLLVGASVGDSGAVLVDGEAEDGWVELTAGQQRKPLLGSRGASPVGFSSALGGATLLMASDGLWKYAKREAIAAVVRDVEFAAIPRRLLDLVRLRSGALPDDAAIIVARRASS
ncbi:hypothetical protein [Nannocystis punicea]|uniref:PPM-type phosphatase domain-containing protein n=1 Tax=Nannocystis punicea TaxID=2995304 RepID=A0ABY7HB41_9BACT|nr:hypothetical protein [Nannocystis poenicansa]WAS96234.1 hypothetical protein O0S08_08725 [Nannocystis poenicansa]